MYFLTLEDPDYTIKGSRDPLGLQVIWQGVGRRLIPHLSTVSNNIIDFQILSLAHHFKEIENLDEQAFELFFIRFEQVMAYVRYFKNENESFNGINIVRKVVSEGDNEIRVSNLKREQLLSNQKAYGIWGKYNRPFSEMGILEDLEFHTIQSEKLNLHEEFVHEIKKLSKKNRKDITLFTKDQLERFASLLNPPTGNERLFWIRKILTDTCDNELFKIFSTSPELLNAPFFSLIHELINQSNNEDFKRVLELIRQTELTICPLNRMFKYLQQHSYWKIEELVSDKFLSSWCTSPEVHIPESIELFNLHFLQDNLDRVRGLVKRNEDISIQRGSAPWMELTERGLEVNHFEGAFVDLDYDPQNINDYTYFLNSYCNLFKQLHE